jgi:hypothetical protein
MRPLIVPLEPSEAARYAEPGQDVVPLLLDRLGSYCSICERPLLENAFAWDSETRTAVSPLRRATPSSRLLLLCRTCDQIQAEWPSWFEAVPDLTLPFEGPTFTLDERRLFSYGWQGEVLGPVDTVLFFGLRLPESLDPRARLRGWTWRGANHASRRLAEDESGREWRVLPHLIVATGFLSTWASTLLDAFGSAPPVHDFLTTARDRLPGFFPGTDWGRMLGEPMELL